jgi:hypothetical protein
MDIHHHHHRHHFIHELPPSRQRIPNTSSVCCIFFAEAIESIEATM